MERRDSLRPAKSRRNKPCDLCRQKKLLCDLSCGPPCTRCQKAAQPCVFVQRRAKRACQKSSECQPSTPMADLITDEENQLELSPSGSGSLCVNASRGNDIRGSFHTEQRPISYGQHLTLCSENNNGRVSPRGSMSLVEDDVNRSSRPDHVSEGQTPVFGNALKDGTTNRTSLENIPGAFSFYIGPTGVSDVHLLLRQLDGVGDVSLDIATGLNIRTVDRVQGQSQESLSAPVIFGVTHETLVETTEPRAARSELERMEAELWSLISRKSAYYLVRLYTRFIEPCFSVLSPDQLSSTIEELDRLSLALLASICAASLPFALHEPALYPILPSLPKSERLYRISWSLYCQQLHSPNLETLQTCLVLQHSLPTNPVLSDTAFKWSHMASAVAIAQTIGLHRDPSSWLQVPEREIKLRRKLWWAMWSMEKWFSLARGMPSHLHTDHFDVEALRSGDLCVEIGSRQERHLHFKALVSLTTILSDIQNEFYTVKAVAITSQNLELSLEKARPLRVRLQQWRDELPEELKLHRREIIRETDNEELDANASLHLCYITTLMTMFRALLRPLAPEAGTSDQTQSTFTCNNHPSRAVLKGGLNCAQEFVNLLDIITDSQWNAFWHSCEHPIHQQHIARALTDLSRESIKLCDSGIFPDLSASRDGILQSGTPHLR